MSNAMTWRQRAAAIIAAATSHLPADTTLAERQKIVASACPPEWRYVSWPQKAWQAARRDYLVRYGYQPRTKRAKDAGSSLPLFDGRDYDP